MKLASTFDQRLQKTPPQIWAALPILVLLSLIAGCNSRSKDADAIRKNYVEFRDALVRQDYDTATNYLSTELLGLYSNPSEMVSNYFRTLPNDHMRLTGDAWVEFDLKSRSEAYLFPNRPSTVGYGFVKETNGWKITVEVLPVVD